MIYLKQSTASQEVPLGYFLDSTDGDTAETALSIANTDIKLWKNGATTLANKNSGGATHISGGIYYAVLDATDTNTLGPMVIFVHMSGALTVRLECLVLPSATYDALITNGLNDISAATVNAQCDTALADYDAPTKSEMDSGFAALNDLSAAEVNAEVDTALADYDAPTKAELDSGLAALNDLSAAEVNAEVDTALADYDAPTNTEMTAAFTAIKGATWSSTTDTLEAIRDRGDAAWVTGAGGSAPSAADIRAEIDSNSTQLAAIVADTNELQSDWVNGGRLDLILDARAAEASLPSNFSSLVISGAGRVDALVQGFLDNLITESTAGRIAANFDTFFENADAVTTAVVDDVGGGGSSLTQQQVRDAMKLAPTAGSPAAGSIDEHLDDILTDTGTTLVSQISGLNDFDPATDVVAHVTLVDTCSANTDMRGTNSALLAADVPTNFTDLAISATTGRVDVANVYDKNDYFISGTITSLDGLNNISTAQVNAEVVDVIRTDTVSEVTGVPAANAALSAKINYLFALARNKSTQTATTRILRNDADSATIATETVSDDGTTFTKGEAS